MGKKALVADAERAGVMSAHKAHAESPEITILTDPMAALKKNVTKVRYRGDDRYLRAEETPARFYQRDLRQRPHWHPRQPGTRLTSRGTQPRKTRESDHNGARHQGTSQDKIKACRVRGGFGVHRTAWGHRALVVSAWCRTNRGP